MPTKTPKPPTLTSPLVGPDNKLNLPQLTCQHVPIVAPAKIPLISRVVEKYDPQGNLIRSYNTTYIKSPKMPSDKRREQVVEILFELVNQKQLDKKFADILIRMLRKRRQIDYSRKHAQYCVAFNPNAGCYGDLGFGHARKREVLNWITQMHQADRGILNLSCDDIDIINRLIREEKSYVKVQLDLKEYREKHKSDYERTW